MSDATITNESVIKVYYGPQPDSDNGGSAILSYELQIDNGRGGNFTSLIGYEVYSLETSYTLSYNITAGGIYRFRCRSLNINGWSSWSEITYIKAASVPSRPPAPKLINAISTSI